MPDDDDPLAPPAGATFPRGGVTCGLCESRIAADGTVLKAGERGKALIKLETGAEKLEQRIAELETQLREQTARADAAEAKLTPAGPAGDDW